MNVCNEKRITVITIRLHTEYIYIFIHIYTFFGTQWRQRQRWVVRSAVIHAATRHSLTFSDHFSEVVTFLRLLLLLFMFLFIWCVFSINNNKNNEAVLMLLLPNYDAVAKVNAHEFSCSCLVFDLVGTWFCVFFDCCSKQTIAQLHIAHEKSMGIFFFCRYRLRIWWSSNSTGSYYWYLFLLVLLFLLFCIPRVHAICAVVFIRAAICVCRFLRCSEKFWYSISINLAATLCMSWLCSEKCRSTRGVPCNQL